MLENYHKCQHLEKFKNKVNSSSQVSLRKDKLQRHSA